MLCEAGRSGSYSEYDLPKDKFRQARIARQRVTSVHLAPLSGQPFQLLEGTRIPVTVFLPKME